MTRIPVHTVASAPEGSRDLFTNYFNHLVQTELDLPAAPEL